ncbi:nucleotidyltransferase [Clostridiaceae bacterium 35-E11]
MNVLGIVAEYNPFHNGHKYHLLESKRQTKATHTVVIMSGNFLQRGEPALTNKWIRAEMAVKEGVDLVIELPIIYACNSAELFAYGSISLLNHLKIVDFISFGSEAGNIEILKEISSILATEPLSYQNYLKSFLAQGLSFPDARAKALYKYINKQDMHLHSILHSPNNILGIEYIKALMKLNSSIMPFTLNRIKASYHSIHIEGDICSATAIRSHLSQASGDLSYLQNVIPKDSFYLLAKSMEKGFSPVSYADFDQMILSQLRRLPKTSLLQVMDVNEGLENRIKEGCFKATSIENLLQLVKTKRYTRTRLQRIFLHSLLGITHNFLLASNKLGGPQYARVLALSSKGAELLKKAKQSSNIPILTNINKQKLSSEIARQMLSFDILSTDLYSLSYPNIQNRIGSWDYYHKPYTLL